MGTVFSQGSVRASSASNTVHGSRSTSVRLRADPPKASGTHENALRLACSSKKRNHQGSQMLAPTPCSQTLCGDLAIKEGRCANHQRPRWQGSTRKQRLPQDWNTRRLVVLKRDKGICYVCQLPGADTVDHVTPGDDHSLTNLKAIHQNVKPFCHRAKSSAEGHAAKAANKIRKRR